MKTRMEIKVSCDDGGKKKEKSNGSWRQRESAENSERTYQGHDQRRMRAVKVRQQEQE